MSPSRGEARATSSGNAVVGALVGYVASRTMDRATGWFYARQTQTSKQREDELAPGGTLVQLGTQLGEKAGRDLSEEDAGRVGLAVHRTLGVSYGMIAAALVRAGFPPFKCGVAVGTGAFVLIDEGTAASMITDYPIESHLRGVVGHGTLGLVIGLLLSLVDDRD